MDESVLRPVSGDDRKAWKDYWASQGMPWRTEPEVGESRQQYLAERRKVMCDVLKDIYPFHDASGPIHLDRADVEWLLATLASGGVYGPVDGSDPQQRAREGLHLEGCDLRVVILDGLPLDRTQFNKAFIDGARFHYARLQGASFYECHGTNADFRFASLEGANFSLGEFREAVFGGAHLAGAAFGGAALEQADFAFSDLRGAYLVHAMLGGADLRRCSFDAKSDLTYASFGNATDGYVQVADVDWGNAILTGVIWGASKRRGLWKRNTIILGDETLVRTPPLSGTAKAGLYYDLAAAIRANLQLVRVLRDQGADEQASEFAFRARVLQRETYWEGHSYGRWLFSAILQYLAGYGLRPLRTLFWYLLVLTLSTAIYCWQDSLTAPPHTQLVTTLGIALVNSITAVHGRGFVPSEAQSGWLLATAAFDAVAGLVIEASFIATFTQRFFAR